MENNIFLKKEEPKITFPRLSFTKKKILVSQITRVRIIYKQVDKSKKGMQVYF